MLHEPTVHRDSRGFLFESYHREQLRAGGIDVVFVQDNHSLSGRHTLRGMHYQAQPGQAKLVRVVRGHIYDVAVDIRPSSATFGQHLGVELDAESHRQLFIPNGFAHGFCVLSDNAEVLYRMSSYYDPTQERGFRFDDPEVGIRWPVDSPVLSVRDQEAEPFAALRARLRPD